MLLSGRLSWDKDEDNFVFNLIQPHANDDYYGRTWLGGSCLHGHGGGWKWDDGTPWDYENWNQGRFCATISCNTYTYTFPWLESRPQNVWAWHSGTFDSVKWNYHDTFTQLWCFIPFFIKVVLIDAAGQGDQICNGSYDCVCLGADASDLLPYKWSQSVCDFSKVFDCICKKPFNLYTHFMWRLISLKIVPNNRQKYTTSFFIWIVGFMWSIMIFEIFCGINVGLFVRWHLRRCHDMSLPNTRLWKWSNGIERVERDLFWCISMTNNVKSCKKINGRAEISRFSVSTRGR